MVTAYVCGTGLPNAELIARVEFIHCRARRVFHDALKESRLDGVVLGVFNAKLLFEYAGQIAKRIDQADGNGLIAGPYIAFEEAVGIQYQSITATALYRLNEMCMNLVQDIRDLCPIIIG